MIIDKEKYACVKKMDKHIISWSPSEYQIGSIF